MGVKERSAELRLLLLYPFLLPDLHSFVSIITENGKAFRHSDFISCKLEFETGGLNGV
jgi:hypothetical protein